MSINNIDPANKLRLVKTDSQLLSLTEASQWASEYLKKRVTPSNISYLIQYGKIRKMGGNGDTLVKKDDLVSYYKSYFGWREINWKKRLGDDLDWHLSFDHLRETDTTKHVHRLHPYKGKFIPQLVQYFLDDHIDEFKKIPYFKKNDIVLDPFCGSGTTLVQANELHMHAIGIDISYFNSLMSDIKLGYYDLVDLHQAARKITEKLKRCTAASKILDFDAAVLNQLTAFNNKYFPSPGYKYKVQRNEINEDKYGTQKEKDFLPTYLKLVEEHGIKLKQKENGSFVSKWFLAPIRLEIDHALKGIEEVNNQETKNILKLILSRTVRSCRATTHSDLATLKEPMIQTYYCTKHGKICKPLFSILSWWERYCEDTIKRLRDFERLKTKTFQACLTADSRTVDIFEELKIVSASFGSLVRRQKIAGIFSSPPYVGLIDYHEQHAYAYDLFGFPRHDNLEIGPLCRGQGKEARESYVEGISNVLINCKKFLA